MTLKAKVQIRFEKVGKRLISVMTTSDISQKFKDTLLSFGATQHSFNSYSLDDNHYKKLLSLSSEEIMRVGGTISTLDFAIEEYLGDFDTQLAFTSEVMEAPKKFRRTPLKIEYSPKIEAGCSLANA